MNQYETDNAWQRRMRDNILAPAFYGKYATQGRYVFMDKGKLATQLQRDAAVDTIVQGNHGAAICIEEKIVRWPRNNQAYDAFTLETHSCTVAGREKDGWMKYGQADFLLYCFANKPENALSCYLIRFAELQAWFWPRVESWRSTRTDQLNHSECRIVPIAELRAAVETWHRMAIVWVERDIRDSVVVGFQAIKDRKAKGGPGWQGHE